MEHNVSEPEAKDARLWLTIPRSGIQEMKVRDLDKAFPARRRKKS
jgi:hypothetical protein